MEVKSKVAQLSDQSLRPLTCEVKCYHVGWHAIIIFFFWVKRPIRLKFLAKIALTSLDQTFRIGCQMRPVFSVPVLFLSLSIYILILRKSYFHDPIESDPLHEIHFNER